MKTLDYVKKILELNREWLPFGATDEKLIANFGFGLAEEFYELMDAENTKVYEEFGDCLAYFVLLSYVIGETNESIAKAIDGAFECAIKGNVDLSWNETLKNYFGIFKRFLRERQPVSFRVVEDLLVITCECFASMVYIKTDEELSLQESLEFNVNKLIGRKQRNGNFNGSGDR